MSQTNDKTEVAQIDSSRDLVELLNQLDEVVAWFNGEDINVEQATQKFDEGVKLVEIIKAKLTETDNKINQIKLKLTSLNE